jgi:hypothetical protein
VGGGEEPRDGHLTSAAAAPDLSHDAPVRPWNAPGKHLALQKRYHFPIPAFGSHERSRVEHQRHAAPRRRRGRMARAARSARTGSARWRAARTACSISWGVISPCSASYASMNADKASRRRSCSTLSRSASLTHALTVGACPRLAAASAAPRSSASTEALRRFFDSRGWRNPSERRRKRCRRCESALRACIAASNDPAPGCGDELSHCMSSRCGEAYECGYAAGCLSMKTDREVVECCRPCLDPGLPASRRVNPRPSRARHPRLATHPSSNPRRKRVANAIRLPFLFRARW